MIYKPYDIVVVPFPFTEKSEVKHRPAVVLSTELFNQNHDHLVLAMITSAKHSSWDSDVIIQDWAVAALTAPCKIRFKFFSLPQLSIIQCIGNLSNRDRNALLYTMKKYIAV